MVGWLVLFVIAVAGVVALAAATSNPRNRRTYLNSSYGDGGSTISDSGTNCDSGGSDGGGGGCD
jgi:hypothetical protein